MSPTEGRPPVSPRLLDQLSRTLRAVEEARREEEDREEAVGTALDDLESLSGLVEKSPDGSLPEGLSALLEEARASLEEDAVEEARETLVEVGRSIDDFLKG